MARVTKRVKQNKVNPRGIECPTFFAGHSLYEVSFPNDQTEEPTANVIAKNMPFQVDSEVHHYQVINYISEHFSDGSTLNRSNGFIRSRGGNLPYKKTTRG